VFFPLVCFHLASCVAKSESTQLVELVKRLWIFSFFGFIINRRCPLPLAHHKKSNPMHAAGDEERVILPVSQLVEESISFVDYALTVYQSKFSLGW
jgi:hypothetical protein